MFYYGEEYMTDFIYDVTELNFEEKIIAASTNKAVVVDFWAEWCAPCKMLGPVIEKVVNSFNGRVALAKVNVDQSQQLAAAFGIRSIPTVKIVKNGSIVQEFVGALPEDRIRAMIEPFAGEAEEEGELTPEQLISEKRFHEARQEYLSLLEKDSDDLDALSGLIRVAILEGDIADARKHLADLEERNPDREDIKTLHAHIDMYETSASAGDEEELIARHLNLPDDLDACYLLACRYAMSDRYEEALALFLDIVVRNRSFGNGKARGAMVAVFSIIGHDNSLTQEYRQKLASALF